MQARTHKRLIGILGGMGPAATIDFMAKIVSGTPAGHDQEHIPLIVHDVPQIPDRSSAILSGDDAPFLPMLSGIRLLDAAGVDYVAIPCNTAHFWYDRLQRGCRAEVLHIADAVLEELRVRGGTRRSLAVLATRGTIAAGIYQDRLSGAVERVVLPDAATQSLIDRAISAVKAGEMAAASDAVDAAALRLLGEGVDSLLLACTELPVAFAGSVHADATIDATNALARACVLASCGERAVHAET